jgi:Cu(I)/Ag(I) efflux system membrane fusion protein
MKRRIFIFAVFFGFSTISAANYDWTTVRAQGYDGGVSVTGRVIPQEGALNIEAARIQGRILSILVKEGEHVEAGTPLFAVSCSEGISLIDELGNAQKRGLDDLVEAVKRRENQLGLRVDGENVDIVATHEGILTKRNVESGAVFNVGDALATILQTNRLTAELDVPENELSHLKIDQNVKIQFTSAPTKTLISRIQNILPVIDTVTRTVKVRLFPMMMPNGTTVDTLVYGTIETGRDSRILEVPTSALVFSQDREYVVKKGKNKTPHAVEVQVVSETEYSSSVRPISDAALRVGDEVVGKGAIFVFRKLAMSEKPSGNAEE